MKNASMICLYLIAIILFSPVQIVRAADEAPPTAEEVAASIQGAEGSASEIKALIPTLQIPVPGFNAEGSVVKGTGNNGCPKDYVCVYTINRYLNALYRFAVGAGVIFAIVLIMIGGAQYVVGSAAGSVEAGRTRMWNAVFGLALLFSAHAILTFANPAITQLTPLQLEVIAPVQDISVATRWGGTPTLPAILSGEAVDVRSNFPYITGPGNGVHKDIAVDVQAAAKILYNTTEAAFGSDAKKMLLTSAVRSPQKQMNEFGENCMQGGPCDPITCNPLRGHPEVP
ncbi:MAG: hypothetical protein HYZ07_01950, partial [Candidatus Harrisonbacteria bacterium]|nr:hypothetical protein [Candidatus Harrisonbacteria bacterium]